MKLICETCVVNRTVPVGKRPFQKTILAIGKSNEKKPEEPVIMLITNANKAGTRYVVKKNIGKIFTRFISEGKATISFHIPEHDLQIKSEVIQLTGFLKVLKSILTGEAPNGDTAPVVPLNLPCLTVANKKTSLLSSTSKALSTKCVIQSRADYPLKGFNRNLTLLQISDIKLVRFDPQILLLKNLRTLNLSNNCLEKIPKELGQLRLTEIDLSGNVLHSHDWQWLQGSSLQSTLQSLNISGNSLSYFPIDLIYAKQLVRLDLRENHIVKLPFAVWKMARLRFLNLANNRLASVPESMTRMKLDELDLSDNQMHERDSTVPDFPTPPPGPPALWEVAARVVVARKVFYSPGMIPFLLVELMHRTPICACGLLCFTAKIHEQAKVIRLNCQQLVLSRNHYLYADAVFCSQRCINKLYTIRLPRDRLFLFP